MSSSDLKKKIIFNLVQTFAVPVGRKWKWPMLPREEDREKKREGEGTRFNDE